MRVSVVLLAIIGLTAGSVLKGSNHHNNNNNNDNESGNSNGGHTGEQSSMDKQRVIVQLLSHIYKNNQFEELAKQGNNFHPSQNINKFRNTHAVKSFLKNYYNNNFLPKDEVFSSFSQQHQNQAGQLFNFLHSAQDWNTFKQASAWARDRFNPDQFVFAFIAAVHNHPSTKGVTVPALYEVIPHAFVPATALQQLYYNNFDDKEVVVIPANYTNQNMRNKYFDELYHRMKDNRKNNNMDNENKNGNNYNNPHYPNSVYADNDGSQMNNAGIQENPENRVSYFTEDIGINDFLAKYHAMNPAFYGSNNEYNNDENNENGSDKVNYYSQRNIRRGQNFYFSHQQLYARYILERISNGLPIPNPINFNQEIKHGYNPNLQYPNGQAVPARPPHAQFQQQQQSNNNNNNNAQQPNNNQAQDAQTYQHRLHQAAESGYVMNEDGSRTQLKGNQGVGVLANMIAAPASNPNTNFYGDYFSTGANAIGNIVDPNNQNGVAPGAVANYATAARDPAFYKFMANILQIFYNYQNNLGPYKESQLHFPGVKIENFNVTKLTTFFDSVWVNANNALNKDPNNQNTHKDSNNRGNYNVMYMRLKYKPFHYKVQVKSDKNTKAIVRVFIGPKFDSNGQAFTLPQASQYFVQLDKFTVDLNEGQNVIQRQSNHFSSFNHVERSFRSLWKSSESSRPEEQSSSARKEQQHGLPGEIMLPKGHEDGKEFIFYTIINDVNNNEDNDYNNEDSDNNDNNSQQNNDYMNMDARSIGFPFDRPIKDVNYNSANQYFQTVPIYHKVAGESE